MQSLFCTLVRKVCSLAVSSHYHVLYFSTEGLQLGLLLTLSCSVLQYGRSAAWPSPHTIMFCTSVRKVCSLAVSSHYHVLYFSTEGLQLGLLLTLSCSVLQYGRSAAWPSPHTIMFYTLVRKVCSLAFSSRCHVLCFSTEGLQLGLLLTLSCSVLQYGRSAAWPSPHTVMFCTLVRKVCSLAFSSHCHVLCFSTEGLQLGLLLTLSCSVLQYGRSAAWPSPHTIMFCTLVRKVCSLAFSSHCHVLCFSTEGLQLGLLLTVSWTIHFFQREFGCCTIKFSSSS